MDRRKHGILTYYLTYYLMGDNEGSSVVGLYVGNSAGSPVGYLKKLMCHKMLNVSVDIQWRSICCDKYKCFWNLIADNVQYVIGSNVDFVPDDNRLVETGLHILGS